MCSASSDEELVAAAVAGTQEAWDVLIERYQPRILRYLRLQTSDPELAADLTQDTFLTVLTELSHLPPGHPFVAWLYRIAQHRLLRARHRQALRRLISLERMSPYTPSLQADDLTQGLETHEIILQVLEELSRPLRDALLLNAVEGFSASDVALVLNISGAAAKRRISRAKRLFRAKYQTLTEGAEG